MSITASNAIKTESLDRITSGILTIGADANTTGVTFSKPITTSSTATFNGTSLNNNTVGGDSIVLTDGTTTNTITKTGITTRNSEQNSTHFLTFVDVSTSGITAIQKTAGIECNPLSNTITATTFNGDLNGTATNATNVATTADTTTSTAQFLTFVPASTTGNQAEKVNSSLSFIATTGTLETTIVSTPSVNATAVANTLALGNNITTGNIDIGLGLTSGDVNIATHSGKLAGCAVNIGTGGTVANSIVIGSATSGTSIGNTLGVTGLITATGGLTMGAGKNITLQSSYVSPFTTMTFLGGSQNGTFTTSTNPVTGTVLATITLTTAGLYLFTHNLILPFTGSLGTTNYIEYTGSGAYVNRMTGSNSTSGQYIFGGSQVISATASTYTILFTTNTTTFTGVNTSIFKATRIA